MKKVLSVVLIIAMVMCFASCGEKTMSPTETVDKYLAAVKTLDSEEAAKYSVEGEDENILETEDELEELVGADVVQTMLDKITGFEYTLGEEKITDDKATVPCHIKTYEIGNAFVDAVETYMVEGISKLLSGASEEEVEELLMQYINEKVEKAEFNWEADVEVNLTKVDGVWLVDEIEDDDPLLDAILGGLYTALNDLSGAFEE